MSRIVLGWAVLFASAMAPGGPAQAQSGSRLPIPEGAWVDVATPCGAAAYLYVHGNGQFGNIYTFGPNQSLGPADEAAPVTGTRPGRDGYTVFNDGPIEVKTLPGNRVAIRAYSPAHGEVWLETMRACAPESLPPRLRAAVAPYLRASTPAPPSAAAPSRPQPVPQGRWQVARVSEGGIAAYVNGTPALPAIVVRCDRGTATITFNIAGDNAPGPRQITFAGTSSGQRATATFARDPQNGNAWAASPDSAIRGLFTGGDPAVEVQTDGRAIATLSLADASAAFAQALAGCPATASASASASAAAPVPPLGLAPGYYVEEGQPCGDPPGGVFFYDGRRYGMMYPSMTGSEVIGPIGRPARRGNIWELDDGSQVQVLSPTRLRWAYEEMGPPRRLCPAAEVPASVRVR